MKIICNKLFSEYLEKELRTINSEYHDKNSIDNLLLSDCFLSSQPGYKVYKLLKKNVTF